MRSKSLLQRPSAMPDPAPTLLSDAPLARERDLDARERLVPLLIDEDAANWLFTPQLVHSGPS